MSTTVHPQQVDLPGQTHVAEGPHDQTGMYVMHHAFRRDLARFRSAVRNTPVGDAATWRLLRTRLSIQVVASCSAQPGFGWWSTWSMLARATTVPDRSSATALLLLVPTSQPMTTSRNRVVMWAGRRCVAARGA